MDHLISADNSKEHQILNSWLDWTMTLSQLFNHEDNEHLTAMIMDLRKSIQGDFDASQLIRCLEMVQKPISADHWQFTSPAVMLGTAIILAVVSFVIWKKCWNQPQKPETKQLSVEFKQDDVKIIAQPAQVHPFRNKIFLPHLPTCHKLKIFQNLQSLYLFTLKQREGS
jgi:hypothetical protein